jgi:hypothetical protein
LDREVPQEQQTALLCGVSRALQAVQEQCEVPAQEWVLQLPVVPVCRDFRSLDLPMAMLPARYLLHQLFDHALPQIIYIYLL